MTTNTDPLNELNELYCELTWKMRDVQIPVKDKDTTALSNRPYGELLDAGTVVRFNDHTYFYSCPFGMMDLEGAWTDEESVSYSVHEFLCKMIDNEGCVEVLLEG